MKKYKFIIELNENRTTCFGCPLCGSDDYCKLQDEDFCFINSDTWDAQLKNCPLEEVE